MSWAVAVDPIAAAIAVTVIIRYVRRIDKAVGTFKEDWNGTPARPGVPARAGVMERLDVLEIGQRDTRYLVENLDKKVEDRL